jgi:putative acetyltransferase
MQTMIAPEQFTIRRLADPDVRTVLEIISDCRREYGLENRVPALLEPADHRLLDTYRCRRSAYFVAILDGEVVGGAGISHLPEGDGSTCELQRMYVRQASRARGIGHALLVRCVQAARAFRYLRCYAETISEMTAAIAFYERHGFRQLAEPIGRTGHQHNDRWMLLDLHSGEIRC